MGATYLMCYPGPRWQIRGGANPRSQSKPPTNPRAAMREWLAVADAITRAGGHILVMAPPPDEQKVDAGAQLSGLVYAANHGAMFKNGDQWLFMVSKMAVAHRAGEREVVKRFFAEARVPTLEAQHEWEGQSEVQSLKAARVILSWGVRSKRESLEEVRRVLPKQSRTLEVQVKEPFTHGDAVLGPLYTRAGDMLVLAYGAGMVNRSIPELRTFIGTSGDVVSIDEDDVTAAATSALSVNGTVILPAGTSTGLRGTLVRRGFTAVEEIDMPELLGKGGGGPRSLVNEMPGFVISDEAPSYSLLRDKLYALAESYPETAAG
jgi:N-dimethylarginine dimethylaminohydrolase